VVAGALCLRTASFLPRGRWPKKESTRSSCWVHPPPFTKERLIITSDFQSSDGSPYHPISLFTTGCWVTIMRMGKNIGRRALGAAVVAISVLLYWSSTRTPAAQQAQQQASELAQHIKANYTKREVMIPMRDGVKLFTAIYSPKDASQPYPILFGRTPYTVAPYGLDSYKDLLGPSSRFAYEGYIFVYQDVRGKWMSEGDFVDVRPHIAKKRGPKDIDESTDTYDTIEWLLKNVPNHNGRVGMWGISYPGFYVSSGIIDSHPALKAVSPQAPIGDWFLGDDFHHNGAFFLPHAYNFYAAFGQPRQGPGFVTPKPFEHGTPDGYKVFPADGRNQERTGAVSRKARCRDPLHGANVPASEQRPVLAIVENPGALAQHQAGSADGGRLVRRRGPHRAPPLQHLLEILHGHLHCRSSRSPDVRDGLQPVALI
jgi:X-Pro dipeptidyl-peptidase (S15 family)